MLETSLTQRIHISIAFGDAILPIIECDDGHQRVPLKPVVEQVGAQWEGQRRKVQPEKYLSKRLGSIITTLKCGGKPQICIRFDRVTSYLNTLNPENIRGMGNNEAADWLESKHTEWDDVLHNYEQSGLVHNNDAAISELVRIDKIKNPELKRIASMRANQVYGLGIALAKQGTLDV